MPSVEERLDRIERQIAELRESVAYLRGFAEQLDKRLNHVETEIGELRAEIRELRNDLNRRFLWLLGVLISMWVTIIVAVLLK